MRAGYVLWLPLVVGCEHNQWFQAAKSVVHRPADTAQPPTLASAARVDTIGRQILAANLFSGVEAAFQTVGNPQPLLFHRGQQSVFISDALVERCQTDEQLAALLCYELGRMIAEKRNASRMGYIDPMINSSSISGGEGNSPTGDPLPAGESVAVEQASPRPVADRFESQSIDPKSIAIELFKTAGYEVETYVQVEPLLKGLNKDRTTIRQLEGTSPKPEWTD